MIQLSLSFWCKQIKGKLFSTKRPVWQCQICRDWFMFKKPKIDVLWSKIVQFGTHWLTWADWPGWYLMLNMSLWYTLLTGLIIWTDRFLSKTVWSQFPNQTFYNNDLKEWRLGQLLCFGFSHVASPEKKLCPFVRRKYHLKKIANSMAVYARHQALRNQNWTCYLTVPQQMAPVVCFALHFFFPFFTYSTK